MSKQILVIGLGQFGMSLARALAEHGGDVLAVDVDEASINEIAPHVSDTVQMNAMDEEALSSLAPANRDTCVCAIGDENREGSIIVTALLKQLGAPHIISRSTDDLHARILHLVGAHEVINPERNYGQRLAMRLAWRNVVDLLPLGGDLVLTELDAPEAFWGRTLAELELPQRFSLNVAAIRRAEGGGDEVTLPDPSRPFGEGDTLMIVSTEKAARRLTEQL